MIGGNSQLINFLDIMTLHLSLPLAYLSSFVSCHMIIIILFFFFCTIALERMYYGLEKDTVLQCIRKEMSWGFHLGKEKKGNHYNLYGTVWSNA